MLKNKVLLLLSTVLLTGCIIPGNISNNENKGSLKLGFLFPQKSGFSIKAIPNNTESIKIELVGENIPVEEPIKTEIKKSDVSGDGKAVVNLEDIPVGKKTLTVSAFDSSNTRLASASKEVTIESGKKSTVEIELKELLSDFSVKFNNFPSSGKKIIARIETMDGKVHVGQFNENNIKFSKLPEGKGKLKVSVLNDNSFPLSSGNYDVEIGKSSNLNLNLESFSLPTEFELEFTRDDLLNGTTQVSSFIPKKLVDTLKNVIIDDPSNDKPVFKNAIVKVNGVQQTFSAFTPIDVNPGDNIEISVEASDSNSDKLSYFWGVTTFTNINDNYRMRLNEQHTSTFTGTVPRLPGTHAIGFIIFDGKSYVGPVSVPIRVRIL